ncbi:MAG: aminoacyl-tRNA hydrolase [Clostridiales bacterium]|nr:aminoacyl-tRNA hydrolase [Clostridiales bacterium]MDD7035373.1 aminoacyl-tRNA hydrolase [Bacillota bacterium]MDY2920194.1 aminoacyl-tRNA hydrolase [Lentihominibacter sp.]
MYVIAGLGNPGKEYEKTRHNMGFQVVDRLSQKCGIPVNRLKHKALTGEGRIGGEKVMLVKPQTYMNLSGDSLAEIVSYYNVDIDKLIVIYDDFDLEAGALRIRKKGSAGSHNGMKSVIYRLGSDEFPRMRIGIGSSGGSGWKDFVIGRMSSDEEKALEETLDKAAEAAITIVEDGIDLAMNRFNTGKKKKNEQRDD